MGSCEANGDRAFTFRPILGLEPATGETAAGSAVTYRVDYALRTPYVVKYVDYHVETDTGTVVVCGDY